jgi:hypothetical protein
LGHTTISHKAAAIAAEGGQRSGDSSSHGSSKYGGRRVGGDISTNSIGNDGGRQRQGQTTINQKAAEMAVKAAAVWVHVPYAFVERCVTFLADTKSYESMLNLCFTMPALFILTKFVPNKLKTIYTALP